MPELFEQEALLVEDDADYAIDKDIPFEDEPVEVEEDDSEISVVNLPSEKSNVPMVVEEMPFEEYSDYASKEIAKPLPVGVPLSPEKEKELAEWAEKRKGKERMAERGAVVVDEDEANTGEIIPGSDAKFVEEKEDDAKDQKPTNWENDKDHSKFIAYIKVKTNSIPKHSGETIPGCERAKAYLKSLDNEISQAMRSDLKALIDEQQIDAIRKEIEKMVSQLDRQIGKLKKKQRKASLEVRLVSEGQCEKCESVVPMWHDIKNNKMICMHCEAEEEIDCEECEGLEKKAATPIINVYVTPFERAIVGIIVNATVSAGKNIEEVYMKLKNKYNFTPREELAIQQLVADYGYPVFKDRALVNEPSDPSSGDGVDWMTQYYA